jgi:hypothetical protein
MTGISPKHLLSWLGLLGGLSSPALSQTRYPVISKVEILFSLVTHRCHISDRINFYNSYGSPAGNSNYAVPHLVYEPVVTLYNPYNEPLTMNRSRIKIWDPPVGFAFKKNDVFLRSDFAAGQFHGPARFQIQNENDPTARKSFTLSLSSRTASNQPGGSIVLQPGESRTFSTWVETNWTWGLETAGGYTVRSCFDWNEDNDLTNRDGRTGNAFGAEAIATRFLHYPDDPRAGFQTDSLSLGSARPAASRYDFEAARNWSGNWVAIRNTDTVGVQAKAMRTHLASSIPDFQVALLKGQVQDPARDSVKGFALGLSGIIQDAANPVITRSFLAGDILQTPTDMTPAGKTPFASFTMIAKASALRANRFYATPAVPAGDLYELHFKEVSDFGQTLVKPSDAPTGGPEILGFSRSGNTLFIDFTGAANPFSASFWKVRGTASLTDGFPDDLGSVTTVMAGQSGSGIYKAIIDLTGRGDRYFVRIEE